MPLLKTSSPRLILTLTYGALFLGSMTANVQAQTLADDSLGESSSVVNSQALQELVTGGAIRGNGLFHSFQQLNVAEGRSLYFANPDGIEQIFSRVTGNAPSNIDGTLGVLGNADLFLLNPNGVLFGPNAQLELRGSFTASAGVGLEFEGFEFSAVQPQAVPLLNVSAPQGVNFGSNPGAIANQSRANGVGLTVAPFQQLSLSGGDITLDGGLINLLNGSIELTSQGDISLTNQALVSVTTLAGNPESAIQLEGQTIQLDGQSKIFSHNYSTHAGADLNLTGQALILREGSQVASATVNAGAGGNIFIDILGETKLTNEASDRTISNPSFIVSRTLGPGTGGDIQVQTGDFLMEYNGFISSDTGVLSTGNGGNITIAATGSVVGQRSSPSNNLGGGIQVDTRGSGTGGNLTVITPQLSLQDQHSLISLSWLSGQGGNIRVNADEIQLSNASLNTPPLISSGIRSIIFGSGDGGDIEITSQDLTLQAGALVSSLVETGRDDAIRLTSNLDPSLLPLLELPVLEAGNAGDVAVVADTIQVDGFNPGLASSPSQISSITRRAGDAGDVTLRSREIKLSNGGGIGSSSLFDFAGQDAPLSEGGNGGNLTIDADEITVSGSNPLTDLSSVIGTQAGGFGDAGNTTINTRQLSVLDGGLVSSGTFTSGNGGALTIQAQESILVDGIHANGQVSTIGTFAFAPSEALRVAFSLPPIPEGETGQLVIHGDRLTLSNGGTLSVAHEAVGDGGDLTVNVNQLLLQQGQLSATSVFGQGGNVNLNVEEVLALRQGSRITAEAWGEQGNGGNLAISAGNILAIPAEDSDIIANAQGGMGGNISLRTGGLFGLEFQQQLTSQSDITASSNIGLNGTVKIDLLAVNPSHGLPQLPTTPLNPNEQISTACNSRSRSRFVLTGRGGLPVDPRQKLTPFSQLEDWRDAIPHSSNRNETLTYLTQAKPSQIEPFQPSRYEAQGWYTDADGKIRIIRKSTGNNSIITGMKSPCPPSESG